MEQIAARFENVISLREVFEQVTEIAEEFPWAEVGQFIRWTTYLEGLGWGTRTALAGALLWVFIACDRVRRTWGIRSFERWNVVCEYLSHLILGVLVGPLYLLICVAQKLMAANRFSDVRKILVICYILVCFPTLARFFCERRERAANGWSWTRWMGFD